ncbi:MAG: hypothetical protein ACYC09_01070 [Bacteroidota bacterium]
MGVLPFTNNIFKGGVDMSGYVDLFLLPLPKKILRSTADRHGHSAR